MALYQVLQQGGGEYPKIQHMDMESVQWFFDKGYSNNTKFEGISAQMNEVLKFAPKYEYYLTKDLYESIHGIRHTLRVLIGAIVIANAEQLDSKKRNSLLLAAALHDIGRVDDNEDYDHSKRAAEWFMSNRNLFNNIGEIDNQMVYDMIFYHNRNTDNLGLAKDSLYMINLLKSSDGIERYRLPKEKWRPKFELLSYQFTQNHISAHQNFVYQSELLFQNTNDGIQSVIDAGIQTQFIK